MCEASRLYLKIQEEEKKKSISGKQRSNNARTMNSPAEHFLSLQRTIGNRAVQRLIGSGAMQADFMVSGLKEIRGQKTASVWHALEQQMDKSEDGMNPSPPCECACGRNMDDERMSPHETGNKAQKDGVAAPGRPAEAGWWSGNWYTTDNTIICDGSGSLKIHEATSYGHGVQECTRKHEGQHRPDWYARYGADICKGRKAGDLPHYDPPGKEKYADFLKKSECAAWKVGEKCRKEKLKACANQACKNYVQPHVTFAEQMVKKYC